MLKFGVREEKQRALEEEMRRFNVREEDLVEKFIRSRGPGGQKAVSYTHLTLPTICSV